MNEDLTKYFLYLNLISEKIANFFENQKEYIFCHKGCAKCCKNAQFPYKKIEFEFLLEGLKTLDKSIQEEIIQKAKTVIEAKNEAKDEKFVYDCPFLINDVCSVYNFRGVICRSFGLMFFRKEQPPGIPFCIFEGLNYSNVLDKETGLMTPKLYKERNLKEEPMAFNVSHSFLTDEDFATSFGFKFGETKFMIEWFEEYLKETENT